MGLRGRPSKSNGTPGCQSDGETDASGSNGVDQSRRVSEGGNGPAT